MDLLTRDALKALIARRSSPAISLFLPTHRGGQDIQQDPIRLKNLIRSALESPGARAHRPAELAELVKPLHDLAADSAFWHEQGDGLAVFLAPGFLQAYRLPQPFAELAVLSDHFHVKPILPLFASEGRFCLLALSQNAAHLYYVSRQHMTELAAGGPKSLAEALRFDETGHELRGRQRSNRAASSSEKLYHGKGHDQSDLKEQLSRYFKQVDQAVMRALGTERLPVLLAGVEFELALYRSVSAYPHLLEASLHGNTEHWNAAQLQEKARAAAAPYFERERKAAEDKFHELAGTGSATNDLGAVLPAAHEGRVESLFVATGEQRWGRFDGITYVTEQHDARGEGDEDLLDLVAIQTLLHHGRVYAVAAERVPQSAAGAPMAAVFRY